MNNAVTYCSANCKYNGGTDCYNRCLHPSKQNEPPYGGIDRYYVEKCDLFKVSTEKGGAE